MSASLPALSGALLAAVALCIVVVVALQRVARRRALQHIPLSLRELPAEEFERRLGRAMQRDGYSIVDTDPHSMTLRRSGEVTLMWFSRWRDAPINDRLIRRLRALRLERRAAACSVLTALDVTDAMRDRLRGYAISVVGAGELARIMQKEAIHQPTTTLITSFTPDVVEAQAPVSEERSALADEPLSCPRCASPMTLQTADEGNAVGQQFWRCTRAPNCRGMRPAR